MPNLDNSFVPMRDLQKRLEALETNNGNHGLKSGGGGGTSDGMESRVTRLEVEMEHLRADAAEIKADLKQVLATLPTLPDKRDLSNWKLGWLAIAIAFLALTVGSIIGGLGWLGSVLKP